MSKKILNAIGEILLVIFVGALLRETFSLTSGQVLVLFIAMALMAVLVLIIDDIKG